MRYLACTLGLLIASEFPLSAADWPQWRGPNRDGVVLNAPAWPTTLDGAALTKLWRVEDLGPSYSGPIVSEDTVFTTATVEKKREVTSAYDRKTGKKLWTSGWDGAMEVPFFAARNGSWIRSTPAYRDGKLYVAGIKDVLVCFDAKTGGQIWRVDFVQELQSATPAFGTVCSPLVDDTGVYVQAGASLVKLDPKSGKVLWRTLKDDGGMNGSAFSSPVIATVGGKEQLLVQTRTKMAGVDRESGDVLWERAVPAFRGMNILTPVPFGSDGVFTSTYGGTTQLFRIKSDGVKLLPEDGWAVKYEGHMTSPVIVDGNAYLLGRDQRLVCVDLKSGKQTWRSEKSFTAYCSLVANGDQLLALDSNGILYLLKANPKEFEILSQKKVADAETWAHGAVCGDEIAVRDLTGLTLFKWVTPK